MFAKYLCCFFSSSKMSVWYNRFIEIKVYHQNCIMIVIEVSVKGQNIGQLSENDNKMAVRPFDILSLINVFIFNYNNWIILYSFSVLWIVYYITGCTLIRYRMSGKLYWFFWNPIRIFKNVEINTPHQNLIGKTWASKCAGTQLGNARKRKWLCNVSRTSHFLNNSRLLEMNEDGTFQGINPRHLQAICPITCNKNTPIMYTLWCHLFNYIVYDNWL